MNLGTEFTDQLLCPHKTPDFEHLEEIKETLLKLAEKSNNEIQSISQQIEENTAQVETLKRQLDKLRADCNKSKLQLSKHNAAKVDQNDEHSKLLIELKESQSQKENFKKLILSTTKEVEKIEQECKAMVEKTVEKYAKIKKEREVYMEQLRTTLSQRHAEIAEQKKAVAEIKKRLEDAEK